MSFQNQNCEYDEYDGRSDITCDEEEVLEGESSETDDEVREGNKDVCVFGMQLRKDDSYCSDESFEDPPDAIVKIPSRNDCVYTGCYCEENVWKLCDYVRQNQMEVLDYCFAVFISNKNRVFPLWEQKSGHGEDHIIFWDYHVFFLFYNGKRSAVFDLDSLLPFPSDFRLYAKRAIRSNRNLLPEYQRLVRVIPAEMFLETFASDRSHMLNQDGQWIKEPPEYAPICTPECAHNIDDFISMDPKVGYGDVLSIQNFFKTYGPPKLANSNSCSTVYAS